TYFPARDGDRGAPIGFLSLLRKLREVYSAQPDRVAKVSSEMVASIRTSLAPSAGGGSALPTTDLLALAARLYRERFDAADGGLLGAPKFPSRLPIRFLLREHRRAGDPRLLAMAKLTLEKMAAGGMYDHVGGGFHRYSTDTRWLVPHFEKMLYDNALLVSDYLAAYQVTGADAFAEIARETLRYVEREMIAPEGAFYSATDADSLAPDGHRRDGWYFTWTPDEVRAVLGPERHRVVAAYYGVTAGGDLDGRSILHVGGPAVGIPQAVRESKELLYAARSQRPAPARDEKILASWNGLMIGAFAQAA